MKAIVRNDIINLDSYVAAKFKYEKYIEMINEVGGYCFIDQFERHIGKDGRYLITQLINNGFIKSKAFSNFKYCYLTEMSIKYLKYRDSENEFDSTKKHKLTSTKLTKDPSDKVLFSSAIKFAMYQNNIVFGKNNYENYLREFFRKLYYEENSDLTKMEEELNILKKQLDYQYIQNKKIFDFHLTPLYKLIPTDINTNFNNLNNRKIEIEAELKDKKGLFKKNKELEIELLEINAELNKVEIFKAFNSEIEKQNNKIKEELKSLDTEFKNKSKQVELIKKDYLQIERAIEVSVKKGIDYYNKSKIIFLPNKGMIEIYILDTGSVKQAMSYMPLINEFTKTTNLKDTKIKIIIVSFSKSRAESLMKEFKSLLERKDAAKEKISEYKTFKKGNADKYEPDFIKKLKVIIETIPDFDICLEDSAYYIEPYKNCIGYNTNYIKLKDSDRFQQLKNNLKKRENENEKED